MVFEGRNMPPHVSQHCVDAETDKLMSAFGNASTKDMCSKMDMQKVGDTYVDRFRSARWARRPTPRIR